MQVADYGPPAVTVRMTRSYAPPAIIAKLESPFTHDLALRTKTRFAAETRECLRDRLSQLCKREPVAGALDLSWSAAHEAIEDLRRLGSTLSSSLVFDPTNGALFRRYLKQCLFQFRATHGPDTLP